MANHRFSRSHPSFPPLYDQAYWCFSPHEAVCRWVSRQASGRGANDQEIQVAEAHNFEVDCQLVLHYRQHGCRIKQVFVQNSQRTKLFEARPTQAWWKFTAWSKRIDANLHAKGPPGWCNDTATRRESSTFNGWKNRIGFPEVRGKWRQAKPRSKQSVPGQGVQVFWVWVPAINLKLSKPMVGGFPS